MHRSLFLCLMTIGVLAQPRPGPSPRPAFFEPGISPDGAEIAFVSGGDIWTVPAAGGQARLLISNAANDTRPMYSPDGKQLAFVSFDDANAPVCPAASCPPSGELCWLLPAD